MRFDVFRQSDGRLLAVPVVFLPARFVEGGARPQLVGTVTVDPGRLTDGFLKALGQDGCATPEGADAVWFEGGVTLHERDAMGYLAGP